MTNLKLITTEIFGDLSCNFYRNMNGDILLTENVRKAHSFRGGMDSTLFYNLMCMLSLILYTYYDIVYVWKIIIDIQTQQYL